MGLTAEQRKMIAEARDKARRQQERVPVPGQPRPYCEAVTLEFLKCRRWAVEGSRYCGQHTCR